MPPPICVHQIVVRSDIKGCFDHISHQWLYENIPMDKLILEKWLKCGFVEMDELFPTEEGTPQGGTISPILANMALDGLEKLLNNEFGKKKMNGMVFFPKVNLVRYCDDFIITGHSKEILEYELLPLLRKFMQERGLQLSEEKTLITHIDNGFDFLGQNVRKYKGKLLIKPSKKNTRNFLEKVRNLISSNQSMKQELLIRHLNPIIQGWVEYHKFVVSSQAF
jgi:RNA-directed DNA polymerase